MHYYHPAYFLIPGSDITKKEQGRDVTSLKPCQKSKQLDSVYLCFHGLSVLCVHFTEV